MHQTRDVLDMQHQFCPYHLQLSHDESLSNIYQRDSGKGRYGPPHPLPDGVRAAPMAEQEARTKTPWR